MKESLLSMLQDPGNLNVVFQPIFELVDRPNRIHALEASLRGPLGTHFESEALLLEYVRRKNAEAVIDRECVRAVFAAAQQLPADVRIHIKVHIATLMQNPGFVGFFEMQAKNYCLATERFTVELIEGDTPDVAGTFVVAVDAFRKAGTRIGLNNVGAVNSACRLLVERTIDYWKLAPYLAQQVKDDFRRRAMVDSILTLSKSLGSSVVSDGVSTEESLATLALMGVQLVQTNMLCRPIPVETLLRSGVLLGSLVEPSREGLADAGQSARRSVQ